MVRLPRRFCRLILMLGLATWFLSLGGCVERRYTIRSNPPGALAIVNGEEIGATPVSRSYIFYGDREITLKLDGYANKTIIEPFNAPWWDNYATEFFVENLIPYTFRDERDFTYQMEPPVIPEKNDLLSRAESLRAVAAVNPPPRPRGLREIVRGWLGLED